jgi:DNA polymerase delta subunit 2
MLKSSLDIKQDQKCVIVGTLYKDMKLKPSILKEYAREVFAEVTEELNNYVSEDDMMILEDEYGRVKLISEGGKLKASDLISG